MDAPAMMCTLAVMSAPTVMGVLVDRANGIPCVLRLLLA
jgi:hypothetical protein